MSARLPGFSQRGTLPGPWRAGPAGLPRPDGFFPPGHHPWDNDTSPAPGLPDYPNAPSHIINDLIEAAIVAQVAASLPESEGELRSELRAGAASFVDAVLDDYCGTRPPWPGPSPWGIAIASALGEAANTYQAGFLRDELLRIAGQAMRKATAHRAR